MKNSGLLFLLLLFLCACGNHQNAIHPARKNITQVIYASGKIYPNNHVHIAAKVNGYISRLLVKTGDLVKAGTPLLILSAPNSDVNINIAKTNLQLSEVNNLANANQLDAAQQDIQSAYTKYRLDSLNYERYKNLWKENITTHACLDQAKTQADISIQAYKKAISTYDNLKLKLAADLSLAQKQLQLQQNNKSDYIITAPFAGKVYNVDVKEGQLVTLGTAVVDFGEAKNFEAELDVDETDIGVLHIGQQVILSSDAYANHPVNTTVREIEPSVVQGSKTTTVKVDVKDSLQLYSGMSVEANIIITQKQQVLTIPSDYLMADNTVLLKKDKQKIPVQTGIRDTKYVEIISGLTEASEIIKP